MPRAYVTGLKLRPGDKAGDPCEVPGCVRVTSLTWHYRGTCCSKRGCRVLTAEYYTRALATTVKHAPPAVREEEPQVN